MLSYYIQYTTDFHLLAALGVIEELETVKIFLIGPRTKVVEILLKGNIDIEFSPSDPKNANVSFFKMLTLILQARENREITIVSPFVFPFYTFLNLLNRRILVKRVVRTDEGVGSYASIKHYYTAIRLEQPDRSKLYSFLLATCKKLAVWGTRYLGVCKELYVFSSDGSVKTPRINAIKSTLEKVGRFEDLKGRVVYVSQPGVHKYFNSAKDYVRFLSETGLKLGGMPIVKKHPADDFDYAKYDLEVMEGYPLELYSIDDATIFGFSSTALLMAKLIGGCEKVYYIPGGVASIYFSGLSAFNKRLFDRYLTAWNF